jgi:hypothetical protein
MQISFQLFLLERPQSMYYYYYYYYIQFLHKMVKYYDY